MTRSAGRDEHRPRTTGRRLSSSGTAHLPGGLMSSAVLYESIRTPETQRDPQDGSFEFPGIPTTCDGAEAVVHVEIQISQAAGAYPITSSTTMGGGFNASVMNGGTNLWGDSLMFFEPESEH